MSYLKLRPTKPERFEPILMRVTKEIRVGYVPIKPVTFTTVRFKPILCTPPMVYGVNGTPRARMRHDLQYNPRRRLPGWQRYQVIGQDSAGSSRAG